MGIISILIMGLIAGFIGSKIVNKTGSGLVMDIVIGVVGAFVGGIIGQLLFHVGIEHFNLYGIIMSIFGSVIVLYAYHMVRGSQS
ncbi:MAG: GlsB/YeaQ/YmgE family stress response membrane protein [Hyphomicrobiales bacterium]|nr:GlsB/YeaQ/YmgE family stress response membrane protein [Hyphomicrobiales bacterium]